MAPAAPPDAGDRPVLHVTAPRNWCNDPNGPVHHEGRYHLFFQTYAAAPRWGPPSWGHVSSTDLLRWQREPDALTPSVDGPDRDGCWSGCCVVVDDLPRLLYTAVTGTEEAQRTEAVAIAEALPAADGRHDLRRWRVRPEPLIAGPPPQLGTVHHRDPFVVRDEDGWLLLLGSTTADATRGRVLAYRSSDLVDWRYLGDHLVGESPGGAGTGRDNVDTGRDEVDTGRLWECPQLVRTPRGDALLVAVQDPARTRQPLAGVVAHLGINTPTGFVAQRHERVDHGDVWYAPAITRDASGRWLCWGWVQDPLTDVEAAGTSHVGALSLPRVLDVEAGALLVHPAPELLGLRAGGPRALGRSLQVTGPSHEVVLPAHHAARELVLQDAAGAPLLTVRSDASGWQLHYPAPVPLPPPPVTWRDGPAELRVLIDATVVEVFAGDGRAATARLRARHTVRTLTLRGAVDARVHRLALPVA